MSEAAAKQHLQDIPPVGRGWAQWISEDDPSQHSIDCAVQALIQVEAGRYTVPMRADEARALLCCVQRYSSLASRYLLGEDQ